MNEDAYYATNERPVLKVTYPTAEIIAIDTYIRKNWNNTTTSIDEDGYPYPAITESNENK